MRSILCSYRQAMRLALPTCCDLRGVEILNVIIRVMQGSILLSGIIFFKSVLKPP